MIPLRFSIAFIFLLVSLSGSAQTGKAERIAILTDSLCKAGNLPGLSIAIMKGNDEQYVAVAGFDDKEKGKKMARTTCLMQGSVGKTYVAAIALRLYSTGKLRLENKVSEYLGHYAWYDRMPNAKDITVRMLMNHTSGVMRYEFKEQFTKDLSENPGKVWTPEELLKYVLDEKAPFEAGKGWDYSDTNYILLGLIIETITGKKYYDLLQQWILEPFGLNYTFPSDRRKLKGLSQGYAGADNPFGGQDKMLNEEELFIINPQFEWTGGGIYSNTEDLARWGKLLYEGRFIDTGYLFNYAVPAKLGKDIKYGQGVIIRQTPIGTAYGHSGFFPGYMTEMYYFPEHQMCIAVQTNTSDFRNMKLSLMKALMDLARETLR